MRPQQGGAFHRYYLVALNPPGWPTCRPPRTGGEFLQTVDENSHRVASGRENFQLFFQKTRKLLKTKE